MELSGLGEIQLFWFIHGGDVAELSGEAESAEGVIEEVGGGVEIGELKGLGVDRAEGIGEVGASLAERGMEGGDRGAEGGEGELGVVEGGELGEEVVMAGEDLVAELGVKQSYGGVELLGGRGGGAGGEGSG